MISDTAMARTASIGGIGGVTKAQCHQHPPFSQCDAASTAPNFAQGSVGTQNPLVSSCPQVDWNAAALGPILGTVSPPLFGASETPRNGNVLARGGYAVGSLPAGHF